LILLSGVSPADRQGCCCSGTLVLFNQKIGLTSSRLISTFRYTNLFVSAFIIQQSAHTSVVYHK